MSETALYWIAIGLSAVAVTTAVVALCIDIRTSRRQRRADWRTRHGRA